MPRQCSLNRSIVLKALATSCPPIMTAAAACILASRHRTHAVFMRSRGLGALFPDHLRWHRLVGSVITYDELLRSCMARRRGLAAALVIESIKKSVCGFADMIPRIASHSEPSTHFNRNLWPACKRALTVGTSFGCAFKTGCSKSHST